MPRPTGMAEADLYRLMAWLSPAYPVGAYSYSHGLELAVEEGLVRDRAELIAWLAAILRDGSGRNDAILFAAAHRAAAPGAASDLGEVAEIAGVFQPTSEIALESTAQGDAFLRVTRAVWPCAALDRLAGAWDGPVAYPVAVAVTCAGHGVALGPGLAAYLHAFAANLVSAGVRLVPLGQTDGQHAIAKLEPAVREVAATAPALSLDDLGSATLVVDWCAMRHETQRTRLFRS